MKTKLIILLFLNAFAFTSLGQTQGVAYTAAGKGVATTFLTDYHCLGINNSALGWGTGYKNKRFTMGMTEFSLGIYSDALSVDKLKSLYGAIRSDVFNKEQSADWNEQAQNALDYFEKGIMIDASYNWFGFSFQSEKFGGIAFNIQEQYNWYSKINAQTTDIVFRGKFSDYFDQLTVVYGTDTTYIDNDGTTSEDTLNHVVAGTFTTPFPLSDITKGSEIRFAWNRYYNIGYGKKLIGDSTFAIYAGIGGRFIQSTAMFNLMSDDDGIAMMSSLSPNIGINYGAVEASNPSAYSKRGGIPTSVGNGYGIDLSVSARLFNKLKIGLAVNNIGAVTYKRNVYEVADSITGTVRLDGMDNANITNAIKELVQDGGLLTLVGTEQVIINNAASIRLGASLDIGKIASVGVDFVAPFNNANPGGIENPVFSIGGEVRPIKWIQLSAGYYGGGIYAHNIPVGINFVLGGGTYEFGISSRDALTFFTKNANSVSTAFGVARFRF